MRKFLFYIILLTSLLYSCSKEKRTTRKLTGYWELTSFKITSDEGWTVFPAFDGYLNVGETSVDGYQLNTTYWTINDTVSMNLSGRFQLLDKAEQFYCYSSTGDSLITSYRILTLTSSDLQLEELLPNGFVRVYLYRKTNE